MMRLGNADISGELQYKTCADQVLFYARDTGDVYNSVSQAVRKPCIIIPYRKLSVFIRDKLTCSTLKASKVDARLYDFKK